MSQPHVQEQYPYGPGVQAVAVVQTANVRTCNVPDIHVDKYNCMLSGGAHIVIGVLITIFGIVAWSIDCFYGDTGLPIWTGMYFVCTGSSATLTSRTPGVFAYRKMHAYMWMSCFAAAFAICLFSVFAASMTYEYKICFYCDATYNKRRAIDATIITLGIVELFVCGYSTLVAHKFISSYREQLRQNIQGFSAGPQHVMTYPQDGSHPYSNYAPTAPGPVYPPPQHQDAPPSYSEIDEKTSAYTNQYI